MARIMLFDRKEERRRTIKAVFEMNEHEIFEVADIAQAWAMMQHRMSQPDLIICVYPQEDLPLFFFNKDRGVYRRIPVIFLLEQREIKEEEMKARLIKDYYQSLRIPVNLDKLLAKAEEMLSKAACK